MDLLDTAENPSLLGKPLLILQPTVVDYLTQDWNAWFPLLFAVSSLWILQEVPLIFPKCQSGQGEFLPAGCSLELKQSTVSHP